MIEWLILASNIVMMLCLMLMYNSLKRELCKITRSSHQSDETAKLNSFEQRSTSELNSQHETLPERIQSLRLQGLSYSEIAKKLGISRSLVYYYLKKRR